MRCVPSIPSFFLGFYYERILSFAKDLSMSVDMIMLFLYLSLFIARTIPGLPKRNVVYCGVYDLANVLLNLVCKYFIEKFCIYVLNGNQATICWLLMCLYLALGSRQYWFYRIRWKHSFYFAE